ncbi:MAG: NUDIX hydrolase [Propionibacteriaceae bacterium]|nr:NUDIX hydrolase [Propionibacteriaceae bacterium]
MIADQAEEWSTSSHRVLGQGHIVTLQEDDLKSPSGEALTREYVVHPGSVVIVALDDQDRVAVVHQFRHPVQMRLVELPAGLIDVAGEPPLLAAQRELAEEAGLAGADWRVLADFCSSPGISDEATRIYLARGLTPARRPDGFTPHGEEVDMGLDWVPITQITQAIRAGLIHNAATALGVTTLALARCEGDLDNLRPGDAPWPMRERILAVKAGRGDA